MERPASEWFGDYLEKNSNPSWKELETEINGQFGRYSNMTKASRALVDVRQKREESVAALVGRVSALAKVSYSQEGIYNDQSSKTAHLNITDA